MSNHEQAMNYYEAAFRIPEIGRSECTYEQAKRYYEATLRICSRMNAAWSPGWTYMDRLGDGLRSLSEGVAYSVMDPGEAVAVPVKAAPVRDQSEAESPAVEIDGEYTQGDGEGPPRPRSEKTRMTVDLTPELKAALDSLAENAGVSRADILRQAIQLLTTIKEAQDEGLLPALIDRQANVKARLVGV